jgi:hypothetical protein
MLTAKYWIDFGGGVLAAFVAAILISAALYPEGAARRDVHRVIDYLLPVSRCRDQNAPSRPAWPEKSFHVQNGGGFQ